MTSSEILNRNKELRPWWVSIIRDERFDQVMAFVRAELAEANTSWDELKGANKAIDLLKTMTESPIGSQVFPSPMLDHRTADQIIADKQTDKKD